MLNGLYTIFFFLCNLFYSLLITGTDEDDYWENSVYPGAAVSMKKYEKMGLLHDCMNC